MRDRDRDRDGGGGTRRQGGGEAKKKWRRRGEARDAKQGKGEEHPPWSGLASGLGWHTGRGWRLVLAPHARSIPFSSLSPSSTKAFCRV